MRGEGVSESIREAMRKFLKENPAFMPTDLKVLTYDMEHLERSLVGDRYIWAVNPVYTMMAALNKLWSTEASLWHLEFFLGNPEAALFEVQINKFQGKAVYGSLRRIDGEEAMRLLNKTVTVYESKGNYTVVIASQGWVIKNRSGELGPAEELKIVNMGTVVGKRMKKEDIPPKIIDLVKTVLSPKLRQVA